METMEIMTTVTTVDLAKEVGLTPKAVRCAIHRGDLQATRVIRGLGRVASATEFVIQRADADDWKARRSAKRGGPFAMSAAQQDQRRRFAQHGYFATKDDEDDDRKVAIDRLKRDALAGIPFAREQLREDWERGGVSLLRWWRKGIGEIIAQGPER
jgi:hypothetical protein